HLQTQIAPGHRAAFEQLADHPLDEIDRDAEGHAAVAAGVRGDGRVDANHLAVEVEQRPATGARVNGRVGLQKVLDADRVPQADLPPLPGTDDAVRHGLIQAERAADGQYPLPYPYPVAIAQGRHRQVAHPTQAQQGNVRLRVGP